MVFEKSKTQKLAKELFEHPTSEYRGAPFWSWNDELEEAECVEQAGIFHQMGFGGYHMHPRAGLATPYLGEKFMSCVKACVEDAKKKGMLAWLYDEDRYPSGFAGGAVTKDGRFRRRALVFTAKKMAETALYFEGRQTAGAHLLATYAVRLVLGKCLGYTRLNKGEKACGKKFYAYLVVDEPTDGFNLCGYVDALSEEALTAFADYTYGAYKAAVGEEFGKTVPAIFTDEPQTKFVAPFKTSLCPRKAVIPWTDDFEESFQKEFGYDVLDVLPEIFFDAPTPTVFRTRYAYHTHRTERFARAFSDNLGKRCADLGIHLTGHLMEEPTLTSQSKAVGETMRHYKNFGIPGLDLLCGRHEYSTAKQVQSVVRQEGKEGMLCELYGVSRWVVEFGKFKEEGDWLACLGVTVRVPHLSYYSMRGEAKRDYPPSIFYQAPWWKKFPLVEDHFARLNTALTRGQAVNDVAVIHPIESYFLHLAAENTNKRICSSLDKKFLSLTDWLLFGGCDFDFISESLLPSQRTENALCVGKCAYKTILVPSLLTMRRSTLSYLRAFRAAGGKVVFLGDIPSLIEGMPSDEALLFAKECEVLPFEKDSVLSAIGEREVVITSQKRQGEYLSQIREDGESRWLFLTAPRAGFPHPRSVPVTNDPVVIEDDVLVGMKGSWKVTEYDTMTGDIFEIPAKAENGRTYIKKHLCNNDSLLLFFERAAASTFEASKKTEQGEEKPTLLPDQAEYTLSEPNALLLDKAKWSVGSRFHGRIDVDHVTVRARKALGLPAFRPNLQPWIHEAEGAERAKVTLRFEVNSEIAVPAHFACEYKDFSLTVNGNSVQTQADGYYVDKAIRTYPIDLCVGKNVLDVTFPLGVYDCCENCYLLGAFGVDLCGTRARIVPLPKTLSFEDVTKQKMPFYSGAVTYRTSFAAEGERAEISFSYASALLSVRVNEEERDVLFAPYRASFQTKKGQNTVEITAYVSRENAFGAVHIRRKYKLSDSPKWFHKMTLPWRSRRYVLDKGGLLSVPQIKLIKEE